MKKEITPDPKPAKGKPGKKTPKKPMPKGC